MSLSDRIEVAFHGNINGSVDGKDIANGTIDEKDLGVLMAGGTINEK